MLRIAITEILLFVAPFVAFGLYLRFGRGIDRMLAGWSTRAFAVCTLVALLLVALSLYLLEWENRGPTQGRYVPPTWQNGVLVPGHIE
ncbi:DUF6111 family protein [Ancylobacter sp. 6x-1]|uniref:DUF6111 family protein n=1 Tax=Ancylobacter crimeensis TaxID=2579147 RepID=A0ABT0D9R7_9HYPH|nr:DUF6111 family protein [Ancylobacter crimeensis]MCK0196659.1 DUF6111 family protein [Ancylobacter crimeensis]